MYDVILADPAWPYYGSKMKDAAAGKHYDLMDWDDLARMPVREALNPKGAVFMWGTGPLLHKQIALLEQWGLHYRGVAFVWVKTRKDGGIIHGQGVPPTFVKPTTEFLLAATTMPKGRPFPILDSAVGQVVITEDDEWETEVIAAPRGKHSKKPDIFRQRIVQICGERRRLELFARDQAPGWEATGLELDGTDYLEGRIIPA